MKIIKELKSADKTKTIKLLQKSKDGYLCETAVVDYFNKNIICFSCSLGCPIGCKMCYNGVYKNYIRNLSSEEIVDQIKNALKYANPDKITLFSAMGVGEPLLNKDEVAKAMNKLYKENPNNKFAIATTLPKSDYLESFLQQTKDIKKLKVMISLHATNSSMRYKIIPLKTNIKKLVKGSITLSKKYNREIEFNYLLFDGFNDTTKCAKQLAKLIPNDCVIKINHFNYVEGVKLKPSENYERFISELKQYGKLVEEYSTNGEDIGAACGQMCSNKKVD